MGYHLLYPDRCTDEAATGLGDVRLSDACPSSSQHDNTNVCQKSKMKAVVFQEVMMDIDKKVSRGVYRFRA